MADGLAKKRNWEDELPRIQSVDYSRTALPTFERVSESGDKYSRGEAIGRNAGNLELLLAAGRNNASFDSSRMATQGGLAQSGIGARTDLMQTEMFHGEGGSADRALAADAPWKREQIIASEQQRELNRKLAPVVARGMELGNQADALSNLRVRSQMGRSGESTETTIATPTAETIAEDTRSARMQEHAGWKPTDRKVLNSVIRGLSYPPVKTVDLLSQGKDALLARESDDELERRRKELEAGSR